MYCNGQSTAMLVAMCKLLIYLSHDREIDIKSTHEVNSELSVWRFKAK